LGHLCRLRGEGPTAVWYFQRGLDLYEIAGDVSGQATAHDLMATANFYTGQWSEAEKQYLRAKEIFALIGNKYSLAMADNNLGGIALNQGRLDEALVFYKDALHAFERTGESLYVQGALHVNLGHTHIRRDQAEEALEHLQIAQQQFEQVQARDWLPELHRYLAKHALLAGDCAQARKEAQAALSLAQELSMRNEEGYSLRVMAEVAMASGAYTEAERHLQESSSILQDLQDEYEWACSELVLARLHHTRGDAEACAVSLERCEPVLGRLGAGLELQEIRRLREGSPAV
jgi:tetratricopeptide (TPR) repeat protein